MSTVVSLPLPARDWRELLRAAVARDSITAVADRVGVSRTTISLVLAGKYPAKTHDALERKVRDALDAWHCPFFDAELLGSHCRRYRERPMPRSSARDLRHWRVCQTCHHNPLAKEGCPS
ncbi:MAG: LacI family transcriptional regulator [Candidatus Competibacter sp.]|nr:LacI family transcriptional regulator [Candidatus Competibacter sp.]MDS4060534.1 LacI family transcriptional regulator [Candidatus Contendobacter sp.]